MKLQTMNDSSWTVQLFDAAVPQKAAFTFTYVFSRHGAVRWQDESRGWNASGTWRIERGKIVTRWNGSKTWEAWDLPLDSDGSTGKRYMQESGTYALKAKLNVVDVGTFYVHSEQTKADFKDKLNLAAGILQESQYDFTAWLSSVAIAYGRAYQSHTGLIDVINSIRVTEDLAAEALLTIGLTFVAGGVGGLIGGAMKAAKVGDFMVDGIKDLAKYSVKGIGGTEIGVFANKGRGIQIKGMPVSPLEWENSVNSRVNTEMAVVAKAINEWRTAIMNDPARGGGDDIRFDASFDPAVEVGKSLVLKQEKASPVRLRDLSALDNNAMLVLQYQFEQGRFVGWIPQAKFAGEKSFAYPDGNPGARTNSRKVLLSYGMRIGLANMVELVDKYCPSIETFPPR